MQLIGSLILAELASLKSFHEGRDVKSDGAVFPYFRELLHYDQRVLCLFPIMGGALMAQRVNVRCNFEVILPLPRTKINKRVQRQLRMTAQEGFLG